MSEVEKLYSLAGVEPKAKCNSGACIVTNPSQTWCKQCESLDYTYPPFTAEKQLELIKWLGELDYLGLMRTTMETKDWIFNSEYNMSGDIYKHSSRAKTFEETLAKLINSIWQDLTDAEKAEIKNILESEVRE